MREVPLFSISSAYAPSGSSRSAKSLLGRCPNMVGPFLYAEMRVRVAGLLGVSSDELLLSLSEGEPFSSPDLVRSDTLLECSSVCWLCLVMIENRRLRLPLTEKSHVSFAPLAAIIVPSRIIQGLYGSILLLAECIV